MCSQKDFTVNKNESIAAYRSIEEKVTREFIPENKHLAKLIGKLDIQFEDHRKVSPSSQI